MIATETIQGRVMGFQTILQRNADAPILPVLWVFRGVDQTWYVHLDGCRRDSPYPDRSSAMSAARAYGILHGGYRLYFQMSDGCFALEILKSTV